MFCAFIQISFISGLVEALIGVMFCLVVRLLSYDVLLFCTVEQRWSDDNDAQSATDVSSKGRRKSDVTDEMSVDENAGTYASICCFFALHYS